MTDHEDYLPGEAPAAHHESHESLGSDEISVDGLRGVLADNQFCIPHDLGGAKHVADTLADLNTKVSDATLDDSGDPRTPSAHKVSHQDGGADEINVAGLAGESAELAAHKILPAIHHVKFTAAEARAAINNIFGADGVADSHISMGGHNLQSVANPTVPLDAVNYGFASGLITNHAALPTVHQDAPGLIETHRLVAGAHHAKYTDAEARALHSPLSVAPSSFFPRYDTNDWELGTSYIKNRITLNAQNFYAGLFFPDNITITKVTFYAYRTDALATIQLQLLRNNRAGTSNIMSSLIPDWTSGYSSMYDDSISNDVVDNSLYFYFLQLYINPNDSTLDALLSGVKIDFTG